MKKKWTFQDAAEIFHLPLLDLMYQAQTVHRQYFPITPYKLAHF